MGLGCGGCEAERRAVVKNEDKIAPGEVDYLRRLLEDIRQDRWVAGRMVNPGGSEPNTHEELIAMTTESVRQSESLEFYGVVLERPGENMTTPPIRPDDLPEVVCYTGNGPTSEKHAEFIAAVRHLLPKLLDAVEGKR